MGLRLALVGIAALFASEASAQRAVAIGAVDSERSRTSEWWRDLRAPSPAEMSLAQEALRQHLAEPPRSVGERGTGEWWQESSRQSIQPKFKEYVLQMTSVLAAPGDYDPAGERPRHILIQGVCNEAADKLGARVESELVTVLDGGDCFFEARYDLRSDRIVRFAANGVG